VWVVVLLLLSLSSGDVHPLIWPTPFKTADECAAFLPDADRNAAKQYSSNDFSYTVTCLLAPTGKPA